ncbi:MAG: alpha/beta hydrolase [Planctomycetes bacterium]|nr:alpha/beta hydrolase [Planctomycetota bacterium]
MKEAGTRGPRRSGSLPLLLLAALACACSTNPVSVREIGAREGFADRGRSAAGGDRLSLPSENLLRALGEERLLEAKPEEALAALTPLPAPEPGISLLLAELLCLRAQHRLDREAAPAFLEAALVSLRALLRPWPVDPAFDPRFAILQDLYNYAGSEFFVRKCRTSGPPAGWTALESLSGRYDIERPEPAEGEWGPEFFDDLLPSVRFAIRGFRSRHARPGLGVPLIGLREGVPSRQEPYYPPEGRAYPATLLLLPGSREGTLAIVLSNPWRTSTRDIGGRTVPIAADLTAPYAYLLARSRLPSLKNTAFFDPDAKRVRQGIFLVEAYDAGKIPVVLVHGLWSSPLKWRDLTNEIWGEEALRARYQVWHYTYPTGAPVLNNARDLREALVRVRKDLDPEGDDPATADLVLVGHSLGGVLVKTVLQHSGERLWDARFAKPLSTLDLSEEGRQYAERTFFFEPLPFVRRAIFLAAPHRGSAEADSFIGRLGDLLLSHPRRVSDFAKEVETRNPGAMRPETLAAPSSVDVLSPSHVVLRALAQIPIAPWVTYHSILGDRTRKMGPEGTDGVVPYESAHLEGAASELVVEGGHDIHENPKAIAEVLRILREHASKVPGAAGTGRVPSGGRVGE